MPKFDIGYKPVANKASNKHPEIMHIRPEKIPLRPALCHTFLQMRQHVDTPYPQSHCRFQHENNIYELQSYVFNRNQ